MLKGKTLEADEIIRTQNMILDIAIRRAQDDENSFIKSTFGFLSLIFLSWVAYVIYDNFSSLEPFQKILTVCLLLIGLNKDVNL